MREEAGNGFVFCHSCQRPVAGVATGKSIPFSARMALLNWGRLPKIPHVRRIQNPAHTSICGMWAPSGACSCDLSLHCLFVYLLMLCLSSPSSFVRACSWFCLCIAAWCLISSCNLLTKGVSLALLVQRPLTCSSPAPQPPAPQPPSPSIPVRMGKWGGHIPQRLNMPLRAQGEPPFH